MSLPEEFKELRLDVVVRQTAAGKFVGQCLQWDIAVQADTMPSLVERFESAVACTVSELGKYGNGEQVAQPQQAPTRFWNMFRSGEVQEENLPTYTPSPRTQMSYMSDNLEALLSSLPSSALARKVAQTIWHYADKETDNPLDNTSKEEMDVLKKYMREETIWSGHTRGGGLGLAMPLEIERKFLVTSTRDIPGFHPDLSQRRIVQGYLGKNGTTRVRILSDEDKDPQAYLTIKGKGKKVRREYEYKIPVVDAQEMLSEIALYTLTKTRFYLPEGGHTLEIDVFECDSSGRALVEVEFSSEEDADDYCPSFPCLEVTQDPRYTNFHIAKACSLPEDRLP